MISITANTFYQFSLKVSKEHSIDKVVVGILWRMTLYQIPQSNSTSYMAQVMNVMGHRELAWLSNAVENELFKVK